LKRNDGDKKQSHGDVFLYLLTGTLIASHLRHEAAVCRSRVAAEIRNIN
jgi:hypothetical protein